MTSESTDTTRRHATIIFESYKNYKIVVKENLKLAVILLFLKNNVNIVIFSQCLN